MDIVFVSGGADWSNGARGRVGTSLLWSNLYEGCGVSQIAVLGLEGLCAHSEVLRWTDRNDSKRAPVSA